MRGVLDDPRKIPYLIGLEQGPGLSPRKLFVSDLVFEQLLAQHFIF